MTKKDFSNLLQSPKKSVAKQYSHHRPFDDPKPNVNLNKKVNNVLYHKESTSLIAQKDYHIYTAHNTNTCHNYMMDQDGHISDTNRTHYSTQNRDDSVTYQDTLFFKKQPFLNLNESLMSVKKRFASLRGNGKKIIILLFLLCKASGKQETPPITRNFISEACNIVIGSVKNTLQRLVLNDIISRKTFKSGYNGYSIFHISDDIFNDMFYLESYNKLENISNPVYAEAKQLLTNFVKKSDTKSDTSNDVVSSYININNNTTTTMNLSFKEIDYSSLKKIGFNQAHIIQIFREYEKKPELTLSAEIIQDSINALAFDLKHNNITNDFKNSPTVVLTALLKKRNAILK